MTQGMRQLTDADVKGIPTAARRVLKIQCDGEWSRVTVDGDGSYTVWNNPQQAAARAGAPTTAPAPPIPARVSPVAAQPRSAPRPVTPAPSRREKSAEAAALQQMVHEKEIKPGVNVVSAPTREPEPEPHVWVGDWENFDWDSVELNTSVVKLRDQLREGLPERVPFRFHADVLALQGFNLDAVEAAIRFPQRVEIRPETAEKRYPVLAFHRGDVVAILGMRNPVAPMCIAAYIVSRFDPDVYHGTVGSLGGGGAKKHGGLPTSVRAMIKQIRAAGGEVDDDPRHSTAEVKYKGQCLGKVMTGVTSKQQVQSDYQRIVRKMHAIDQRREKVGANA